MNRLPVEPDISVLPAREGAAERIPSLDGLRGCAILGVLGCHLIAQRVGNWDPSFVDDPWVQFLSFGWMGVSVFFALSGYLIFAEGLRRRDEPGFVVNFWRRRALRLLPLYLPLVLVAPFVTDWFGNAPGWDQHFSNKELPFAYYLTFTQNLGSVLYQTSGNDWLVVTWSLAVEVQFYVLACLLLVLFRRERLRVCLVLLWGGVNVLRYLCLPHTEAPMYSAWFLMPFRFDCFALGGLIALAPPDLKRRWYGVGVKVVLVVALLVGVLLVSGWLIEWTAMTGHGVISMYSILQALIAGCLLWLSLSGGWTERALTAGVLRTAGRYSYFLYLYHLPFMMLLPLWVPNKGAWFILFNIVLGAILYGAAALSHRFVETPFLRFRGRGNGIPAAAATDLGRIAP